MRRRDFLASLGAAVLPFAARAQDKVPVVGYLSSQSPDGYGHFLAAFRQGLSQSGFVEGRDVKLELRWARDHYDQLPALAGELVGLKVKVIAATGGVASAVAAKAATTSIPVVFNSGEDPVQNGLVASFNRPGGNLTGISWYSGDLVAKRLALLHELTPSVAVVAFLANPNDPELVAQLPPGQEAASKLGLRLTVVNINNASEIEAAFKALLEQGARAVIVASGPFFVEQRAKLIALAARHALPCIFTNSESVVAGGLMSYGNNLTDAYRRNGFYVARILKGDSPADLPIDRSVKFDLSINLKTAKTLGIAVPDRLMALADQVIE